MPELAPAEIKALARIMDELDYYQIMHVKPGASPREVKQSYYSTSRCFHPDANRHLAGDLREAIVEIAKRVTEAYAVLRNPRRREAYDQMLENGRGVRLQLVQATEEARQQVENVAATPQGQQYWNLAQSDSAREDWPSAVRNLQTALAFEPSNTVLRNALDAAKTRIH
ncbi:MAG: J domain-containing protein [Myxococcota bacterium]|nr:J domain-containing protein [bacterium]MDP6073856.1 J domain-containing protein [Myxococcota bacterium]MDP6244527.1 J domain-containing protein [Myxococcota bacterium]MDP7073621.1 J domain-containing protein [Myxococcota bacterium]MDP7298151.1 J domain-containing protein [Myxococcota bacterium]